MISTLSMPDIPIKFYSANWCADCKRSLKVLDAHKAHYEYLDIEVHPEYAREIERLNKSQRRIPTIVFPDGAILVEPSDRELEEKLESGGHSRKRTMDLAIIGGGPAGMTAAIYATREGLDTSIFESKVTGGQAATTDFVENYPGFPEGISGYELSHKMLSQAERFNTRIVSAGVTHIRDTGEYKELTTDDGVYRARSVIIATGSQYRHSGATGEDRLVSRGVHYCATCDGPFYKNKHVAIIGAGNSAFQEGLYLTQFVSHLTFIVRTDKVRASDILKKKVADMNDKITILYNTTVQEFVGESRLEKLILNDHAQSRTYDFAVDGVFVFIGLVPQTEFLNGSVDRDERGFVKTSVDLSTSMPGVFAAGDCRSGATAQIACAVGDGAKAAIHVREYLQSVH